MQAASKDEAFDFLNNEAEDIYTPEGRKAFHERNIEL